MDVKELISSEIEKVPEKYLTKILNFIRLLEKKELEGSIGIAIASETSLKKDWLQPEEDEAWRDL